MRKRKLRAALARAQELYALEVKARQDAEVRAARAEGELSGHRRALQTLTSDVVARARQAAQNGSTCQF